MADRDCPALFTRAARGGVLAHAEPRIAMVLVAIIASRRQRGLCAKARRALGVVAAMAARELGSVRAIKAIMGIIVPDMQ
ncbi:MAG: hypothetical protein ACYDEY_12195 [Acidimicrobiales bacterium]